MCGTNAIIARLGQPSIPFPQQPDESPGILGDDRLGGSGRVVRASVVDDDEFPIGECLAEDAIDCLTQKLRLVVARDDHRYNWHRLRHHRKRQFNLLMAPG